MLWAAISIILSVTAIHEQTFPNNDSEVAMLLANLFSIVPVSVEKRSNLHVDFASIGDHVTLSFLQRIFHRS